MVRLMAQWLAVVPLLVLASCREGQTPSTPAPAPAATPAAVQLSTPVTLGAPVPVTTAETARENQIGSDNRARLLNRDYDGLEKAAQQLRESRETDVCGTWFLAYFYKGVAHLELEQTDEQCDQYISDIKAWIAARPDSITARIVLAQALAEYAWRARGSGETNTVTPEGWHLFGQRLVEAQGVLIEARKLAQKCPQWWFVAQRVALGLEMNRPTYASMVNQAILSEPSYMGYYTSAMVYLLPRWYGSNGDSEEFLNEQTDKRQGEEADIFYARNVWLFEIRIQEPNTFTAHPTLSWGRVRSGFEALLKKYPDSLSVKSEYARLCAEEGDKVRARQLFQQIGSQMDVSVWLDGAEDFAHFRQWSLE